MSRASQVAGVVALYFVVSITLVFVNKALMTGDKAIPAPMFVTWFQCVFTFVLIWLLGVAAEHNPSVAWLQQFPKQTFDVDIAKKMLSLTVMFVGMVSFNQLCLLYVEVSFYNVARSLTIVCNVIFSYFLLGETTSQKTIFCLAIVIFGFFIGAEGEVNFSLTGTVFGVISSCFVSLNSIWTKKVGPIVRGNKWVLAFYNNLNASIMFLPLIYITGEMDTMADPKYAALLRSPSYWFSMFIAGFLGFAIGIVTVMQITITSPLTHNISGTAKACVQTVLALMIFGNDTTVNAMLGVLMTVLGSGIYAYVRMGEEEAAKQAKAAAVAASAVPLTGVAVDGNNQQQQQRS